jgi:hypothetical protein
LNGIEPYCWLADMPTSLVNLLSNPLGKLTYWDRAAAR